MKKLSRYHRKHTKQLFINSRKITLNQELSFSLGELTRSCTESRNFHQTRAVFDLSEDSRFDISQLSWLSKNIFWWVRGTLRRS